MNHFENYLDITIKAGEEYEVDGIDIINNTNRDAHIFFKLTPEVIESEIVDADFEIVINEGGE